MSALVRLPGPPADLMDSREDPAILVDPVDPSVLAAVADAAVEPVVAVRGAAASRAVVVDVAAVDGVASADSAAEVTPPSGTASR